MAVINCFGKPATFCVLGSVLGSAIEYNTSRTLFRTPSESLLNHFFTEKSILHFDNVRLLTGIRELIEQDKHRWDSEIDEKEKEENIGLKYSQFVNMDYFAAATTVNRVHLLVPVQDLNDNESPKDNALDDPTESRNEYNFHEDSTDADSELENEQRNTDPVQYQKVRPQKSRLQCQNNLYEMLIDSNQGG